MENIMSIADRASWTTSRPMGFVACGAGAIGRALLPSMAADQGTAVSTVAAGRPVVARPRTLAPATDLTVTGRKAVAGYVGTTHTFMDVRQFRTGRPPD